MVVLFLNVNKWQYWWFCKAMSIYSPFHNPYGEDNEWLRFILIADFASLFDISILVLPCLHEHVAPNIINNISERWGTNLIIPTKAAPAILYWASPCQSCKAKPPHCGLTVGLCFPWNISAFLLNWIHRESRWMSIIASIVKGFPKFEVSLFRIHA